MAYNSSNNNGRGISKVTSSDEQNAKRRAAKAKQKRGTNPNTKKSQTVPSQLKEFKPETFEVRTSAAALLSAPYKKDVVAAFGKFFHKNSQAAKDLIWALTYKREEEHPLLMKALGLSPEMVSDLPLLLTELAAQYRAYVNPSFMLGPHTANENDYVAPSFMLAPDAMSDEVKHAFNALYIESPAAALFVHMMCANYIAMNPAENIDYAVGLLSNPEEKNFFGGILEVIKAVRMPRFEDRYDLSGFLKPRHEKVRNLLKAMADVKAAEEKSAKEKASTPASDSPLANLDKLCAKAGITLVGATDLKKVKGAPVAPASQQVPKDAKVPVAKEDNSTKDFSYATVASHYELFSSMALETAQLKELDIDPALILKNLDMVREFLKQATQLEDAGFSPCQYPDKEAAIAKVLKAEAARKDAEQLFT